MRGNLAERYWDKVEVRGEGECWPWIGSQCGYSGGGRYVLYGQIRGADGRKLLAHRVGWELAHGVPPGEMLVLHTCDYPLCQNPAHWFLGTHKDNTQDALAKGRKLGPKPNEAKLAAMRAMRRAGARVATIAAEFGCSGPYVSTVTSGVWGPRWRAKEGVKR
jgi:hypothetical protein